jgi:predicted nucleotidyltransferase
MQQQSSTSVRIFYPRFDRQELIKRLKKKLRDLARELPVILVVLIGSYARGNYTVASDVDILVVYQGKEREDAFATVKKTLGISRVEPHVYSEGEYERRRDILGKMVAGGVVLLSR